MLRNRHDLRALGYLAFTTALFFYQWHSPGLFNGWLYPLSLLMAVTIAVISHNHNHLPMWKARPLNLVTNYWIGIFYGHPAIGWVPTHNQNHHKFNNKEGDVSRSPRVFKGNHLLALLVYPTLTSMAQTPLIKSYVWNARKTNPRLFWESLSEYVVFFGLMILGFWLNWRKAFFLMLVPQQVALFVIQVFSFCQHIECDPDSEWNHSRNMVGGLVNLILFNNGIHTVHHFKPGVHWSELPALHAEHEHKIAPELKQANMFGWLFRTYILSIFVGRKPLTLTQSTAGAAE
ncbi:MAG: fatty acid desaturase family protein [Deltaproteobacteria bacterium]